MTRRIFTLMLTLVLTAGLFPVGSHAADLPFVDVSPEAWYYNDVKTAVDSGLVNGKSATTYCPDDLLTYAEAVKLAACMYQKNETGTVSLVNGDPWYQSYVDYAKMKGIIAKDYDWTEKATRAGYMAIFAHALPDASLAAKNEVPEGSIPDVRANHPEAPEIYKLYRAGILQGSDDTYNGAWTKHLCKPADNIKRSEVAAILTRMMFVDKRISFSMAAETPADALKITKQPADASAKVGISEKASFTVAASGGKSPYTYQWYTKYANTDEIKLKDNELNSGTTTATLTLTSIRAMDDGSLYWCVITDAAGAKVTSSAAKLILLADDLKIVKQPVSYTMKSKTDTPVFTVEISGGTPPYEYAWSYVWTNAGFENVTKYNSTDKVCLFQATDAADDIYQGGAELSVWCRIKDSAGQEVKTNEVDIIPFADSLKIVKQPSTYKMDSADDTPVFSVEISGGKAPYSYNWYYMLESGFADVSTYDTPNTKDTFFAFDAKDDILHGEKISVKCVIKDSAGQEVTTNEVDIIPFADSLRIVKQPSTYEMDSADDTPVFSVEISGGKAPYSYNWYYMLDSGFADVSTYDTSNTKDTFFAFDARDDIQLGERITVKCIIKDSAGQEITTNEVGVIPPAP